MQRGIWCWSLHVYICMRCTLLMAALNLMLDTNNLKRIFSALKSDFCKPASFKESHRVIILCDDRHHKPITASNLGYSCYFQCR